MLCISLVDLGRELTTLFEFEVFPKVPTEEMQVVKSLISSIYACIKIGKNTRDGVD